MLGHGALGELALGEFSADTLALTSDILGDVVAEFVDEKHTLPERPTELHHFTSLETACDIIQEDSIRLSHAEYSNDQKEMEEAKQIILDELRDREDDPFFKKLLLEYQNLAPQLDAYIFCMSTGSDTANPPQDILSQWRAYGQDGKGACITLDSGNLGRLALNTPGLRINPVIYKRQIQSLFVEGILNRGVAAQNNEAANASEATIAALVFATPLMKAPGFAEEREWRLIFMPPQIGPQPELCFHPRRDLLAPYIELKYIWDKLRPDMLKLPALDATLQSEALRPRANVPPLVPITKVMVGPSVHQPLNQRAMAKLLRQANRPTVAILTSQIPYRSLA